MLPSARAARISATEPTTRRAAELRESLFKVHDPVSKAAEGLENPNRVVDGGDTPIAKPGDEPLVDHRHEQAVDHDVRGVNRASCCFLGCIPRGQHPSSPTSSNLHPLSGFVPTLASLALSPGANTHCAVISLAIINGFWSTPNGPSKSVAPARLMPRLVCENQYKLAPNYLL